MTISLAAPRPPGYVPRSMGPKRTCLAALALACLALGCASVEFTRETQTSGRFKSSAWAFTVLSIDLPKQAIDIARENASDARLTNLVVESVKVTPNLGWWDWLLDIVGVRRARITGTWGFAGAER
jgi:hypothetical protein